MRAILSFVCLGVFLAGCKDAAHDSYFESETRFRVVRESLYNQVMVERDGDIVDLKFRKGRTVPRQTAVDLSDPERLVIPYSRIMLVAALIQPEPKKILQLGLGGGGLNRYLRKVLPQAALTTAELDSTVRDMAVEYMGYHPDSQDQVVIEDARAFVKRNDGQWDWILVDAFSGGAVPPHLKTKEFYGLLLSRLAPGGAVTFNLHRGSKLYDSDLATLLAVFPAVDLFAAPGAGNVIALAHAGPPPDFRDMNLARFDGSLRRHLDTAVQNSLGPAASGAKVLTDDFAPTEFLQQQR